MSTKEISVDTNQREEKIAKEFLKSIVKSSNRKKLLVHFKLRDASIEFNEWLTYKQYYVLRTINCLEFCKVIG